MKFVIHLHEGSPDHYDLMIERDDILLTWRIDAGDIETLHDGERIHAQRIQDHRKEYLSYEGPISCNRGRVSIYDKGKYQITDWDEKNIVIALSGNIFRGNLEINHHEDKNCTVIFKK